MSSDPTNGTADSMSALVDEFDRWAARVRAVLVQHEMRVATRTEMLRGHCDFRVLLSDGSLGVRDTADDPPSRAA